MLHHTSFSAYHFASRYPLTRDDRLQLTRIFQLSDRNTCSVLGGRCSASYMHLDKIGRVVVKHYRRGGVLGNFIKDRYFSLGKRRCQSEFEQLDRVRKLGVSVPEPILYAYKGGLYYQAWLVTREIEQSQSIAQISQTAPERAESVMMSIAREISILIDHLILHADFHPGNVLVDQRDKVFLIDFDKAGTYLDGKEGLKLQYRRRWMRAVRKHGLPEMLCEKMDACLQESL